jgi:hypothetical protein
MRLGQLARKLALRPSQIVDYLAAQQIFPEEGSNARLSDEVTERIVLQFAPARLNEIMAVEDKNREPILTPTPVQEEPVLIKEENITISEEKIAAVEVSSSPINEANSEIEVIKAPKVELSGLKVLGKIELPEPKKKVALMDETTEATKDEEEKIPMEEKKIRRAEPRVRPQQRKENYSPRPERNPIALEREKKAREEAEKRKEKLEREKEKRAQYYFQRVKSGQPTKAAKIVSEPTESYTLKEERPAPKTWLGKFLRWLNT